MTHLSQDAGGAAGEGGPTADEAPDRDGLTRRTLLKGGSAAALAGLAVLRTAGPAVAQTRQGDGDGATFEAAHVGSPSEVDEPLLTLGEEVLPWQDQPAEVPLPAQGVIGNQLVWEQLNTWLTPNERFFTIKHYNEPAISEGEYRLGIGGLVSRPMSLTLADLKRRARRGVDFTLECSGNTGLPFFHGGIGNARWVGTPLAPLLRRAGLGVDAREVIFWGADAGSVTVRDNPGVLSGGRSGKIEPQGGGLTITEQFARSMSLADALDPNNLLCFEMNGAPLPREHGAPVRLIAPGWYGVANVKWLTHIEVTDQRYDGRFMARDYVTIREELRHDRPDDKTLWTFVTVGRDRLKSAPVRVTRRDGRHTILAAAWGAPIARRRSRSTTARGRQRRSGRHGRRGGGPPPTAGRSGPWTGRRRARASTPSRHGRST